MKNFYYSSDKANNSDLHVIHTMDCDQLPPLTERTLLGLFTNGTEALNAAKQQFHTENFVDCPSCCPWDQKRTFREIN